MREKKNNSRGKENKKIAQKFFRSGIMVGSDKFGILIKYFKILLETKLRIY